MKKMLILATIVSLMGASNIMASPVYNPNNNPDGNPNNNPVSPPSPPGNPQVLCKAPKIKCNIGKYIGQCVVQAQCKPLGGGGGSDSCTSTTTKISGNCGTGYKTLTTRVCTQSGTSTSTGACVACPAGKIFNSAAQACTSQCQPNWYFDQNTNSCKPNVISSCVKQVLFTPDVRPKLQCISKNKSPLDVISHDLRVHAKNESTYADGSKKLSPSWLDIGKIRTSDKCAFSTQHEYKIKSMLISKLSSLQKCQGYSDNRQVLWFGIN